MTARSLPEHHVPRGRLVRVLAGARVGLVVAGGGYGKSALAAEAAGALGIGAVWAELATRDDRPEVVLAALRRAATREGRSALAAALDGDDPAVALDALCRALHATPEPVLLVVDEAHRAGGAAAGLVAAVAREVPAPHRVLLLGRRLPAAAGRVPGAAHLGPADLALTRDEVAAVLAAVAGRPPDPLRAAELHRLTEGWPAAVVLAARRAATPGRPGAAGLAELVDALAADLGEEGVQAAAAAAHLPVLSAEVLAAALGPPWLERLVDAGLPLAQRPDGWLELPGPVREALQARGPLPPAAARGAAACYAGRGELSLALGLLGRCGLGGDVAALMAARPWQDLDALATAELTAALAQVGADDLARHPRALVQAARVAGARAQVEARQELLARARRALDGRDDGPDMREVRAEEAVDRAQEGDDAAAEALARAVLAGAGPGEARTRGRALAALGMVGAFRRDPRSLVRAEEQFAEAAALFAATGEPVWRAQALAGVGYRVAFARGDLDAAVRQTGAALAALPAAGRHRGVFASFHAEALLYVGRFDEADAVLAEAAAIGRGLGDHRLQAYAGWVAMRVASMRGDAAATARLAREVERHPGDWFDHPTGAEFLAEAAEALARVGDAQAAEAYAARAEARAAAHGHADIAWLARASVQARFGDPAAAARLLVELGASPQLPPREEWRVLLLRAHAAARAGDPGAARLAAEAFEAAAALGHPELPALHEPGLAPALAALARGAGSAGAERASARAPALAVSVLGGFAVTADGRPADPPPGRPASLVKQLAVAGGPVTADRAIEELWPEVEAATGRARLRNLLNRVRARCGDLVMRDGEALALAPGVAVDARAFAHDAAQALAAPPDAAPGLARGAVARYRGELLPADAYAPWAAAPRERLRRRYLDLLGLLTADARDRGDLDEAVRLLDLAIAAEPLDEARLLECAELLLAQGRRGSAAGLVARAAALRADLGLPPSARLARLQGATGAAARAST